jgi:hypothetical protein
LGLGGDAMLQADQKLAAVLLIREPEQIAAEDLIALADLVRQYALILEHGQPLLQPGLVLFQGLAGRSRVGAGSHTSPSQLEHGFG